VGAVAAPVLVHEAARPAVAVAVGVLVAGDRVRAGAVLVEAVVGDLGAPGEDGGVAVVAVRADVAVVLVVGAVAVGLDGPAGPAVAVAVTVVETLDGVRPVAVLIDAVADDLGRAGVDERIEAVAVQVLRAAVAVQIVGIGRLVQASPSALSQAPRPREVGSAFTSPG
jgi:hypothetical protein